MGSHEIRNVYSQTRSAILVLRERLNYRANLTPEERNDLCVQITDLTCALNALSIYSDPKTWGKCDNCGEVIAKANRHWTHWHDGSIICGSTVYNYNSLIKKKRES